MPYCTETDIKRQIDWDTLVQLTDDNDSGVIDTDILDRAIADADAEIDAYCGSRYTVPFTTVPDVIRKRSVDITIYNLYARRRGAPDDRKERYTNAMQFLKDVARNIVSLGEDDPDGSPSGANTPEISSSDRIFSREKLKGW
jgi:phage gp36-like protein